MTKQEAFDAVCIHASAMDAKSENRDGTFCAYRGVGGRKCFVGALIPDGMYSKSMEGLDATEVLDNIAGFHEQFGEFSGFILTLQDVHDCVRIDSWRRELRGVAKDHDLSTDVLDSLAFAVEQR